MKAALSFLGQVATRILVVRGAYCLQDVPERLPVRPLQRGSTPALAFAAREEDSLPDRRSVYIFTPHCSLSICHTPVANPHKKNSGIGGTR
jgi:hypothetical protein